MIENSKRLIKSWNDFGLRLSQCYNLMANEAGGYENLGFDEVNMRGVIRRSKTSMETYGSDAERMMDFFRGKQQENPSFFYLVQLDSAGQLWPLESEKINKEEEAHKANKQEASGVEDVDISDSVDINASINEEHIGHNGSSQTISILDPKLVKTKGSGKRISCVCRICKKPKHDSCNCPNK
ncbi:hypothetical protein HHK36_024113 [Tetracentron sinense]|uniref:Uncharacterized protein n=1 Tax=Tetracentron sinense TaxID=13715 RepID=A0A834YMP5_TETSI|nr:hypothetical protein HHK36_024113 [Tetracentron sinense]